MKSITYDDTEFFSIIKDLTDNLTVQEMNNYRQHYNTSCYEHCLEVSYYSYLICKKCNLDYVSAARSSMLHDLFLYDWRKRQPDRKGLHAFRHPRIALKNATEIFDLSNKEQDIILKHMWPVTIILPKYKESYIVTLVDKFCALKESFDYYKSKRFSKRIIRYSYIFLNILLFKIFD